MSIRSAFAAMDANNEAAVHSGVQHKRPELLPLACSRNEALRSAVVEWPAKTVRQTQSVTSTACVLRRPGHFVEVVKGGQVAERVPLEEKPYYLFGRQPDSDVVGDHPSLSRQHCVIQFSKESDGVFLCDLGSTHGTFLNKTRLTAHEHKPILDGDMFQLGYSTRWYVFNKGLPEKAPDVQETPSKIKSGKKRSKRSVTWGIEDDAAPVAEDGTDIDWRSYSETHELTQKQQRVADKIRKLERRKEKLEMESKKIREREEKFEELTPGQIAALLSNEKSLEQVSEEMEELEEAIQTSILEKLHPSAAKARREAKKDQLMSDSDDDVFYDRSKKQKPSKDEADSKILTAEKLIEERESLEERLRFLKARMDEEEEVKVEGSPQEDALDAFMSALHADQERQKKQDRSTEMQDTVQRLEEIKNLLTVVDPDAFYTKKQK